jgi:dipeptidyl aminopeptidase/acylaminoacyl peptidase
MRLVLPLLALLLSLPAVAAPAPYEEIHYSLPAFSTLAARQRKDVLRGSAEQQYEQMRQDARFRLEKIRYRSDGLSVVAYLFGPAKPGGAKRPVVVYNRGSWVSGDEAPALLGVMYRLADAGFEVIAPQYRGSDGGEGRDELGGADVDDVLEAVRLAREVPGADPERVFMYGESRGGMMTFQAIREGAKLRAAATVGAFTDFEGILASDATARAAAPKIWPDFEKSRKALGQRRSALQWADQLTVPLLILHGAHDPLPRSQSLELAQKLDALGRTYELHVVAGGSHTLGERAAQRDAEVIAWFKQALRRPW